MKKLFASIALIAALTVGAFVGDVPAQPSIGSSSSALAPRFMSIGVNPTTTGFRAPPGSIVLFAGSYYWKTGTGNTNWQVAPFGAVSLSAAPFLIQTANASAPSAQVMGALATGIVKNTTTTGVQSIATAGTDYLYPAGVAGGQAIFGGTAASETYTIKSTSHATKGKVIFGAAGTTAYDEVNERWGFGTASPAVPVHIAKATNAQIYVATSSAASSAFLSVANTGTPGTFQTNIVAFGSTVTGQVTFTGQTAPNNAALFSSNPVLMVGSQHATGKTVIGAGTNYVLTAEAGSKLAFFDATPVVKPAANADTSGATLGQLETEVNELKATLRSLGLLTP
jgi:hypothetical protein